MLLRTWPAILTIGWILVAVALGEGLIAAVAFVGGEANWIAFAIGAALTGGTAGAVVLATNGRPFELSFRDAVILTVAAWFVIPVFAAVPLVLPPLGLSPVDAYFEMVSGVTTTGSTVMSGLDTMARSVLLWRALIQWMGGLGIIGLAILLLPFLNVGGMRLFRLESSDRSDKDLPRIRAIAMVVGRIYLTITVACILAYWLLGMSAFDAVAHALTTVCTGGYSTHDASFGHFDSAALEWASVVFMLAGAFPFLAYIRVIRTGRVRERIEPQIRALVATVTAVAFLIAIWLVTTEQMDGPAALTKAMFNVVAVVTTTGYASADYMSWGAFAWGVFFLLTFIGGCTGSTAGGIKMLRFQVLGSVISQQVHRSLYPNGVFPVRYGQRVVADEQSMSVAVFFCLFVFTFAGVAAALSTLGLDALTALSGAATALANVGPGIGPVIGPAGNFAGLSDPAKLILSVAMIMGRLEILTVLVLFVPRFYR